MAKTIGNSRRPKGRRERRRGAEKKTQLLPARPRMRSVYSKLL